MSKPVVRPLVDVSEQKFGRLLALNMVREPGKDARVRCMCECGKEKIVILYNLRNGNTTSCGCLSKELTSERSRSLGALMGAANLKHGHAIGYSHSSTYSSWQDAKKRCYSLKNKRYAEYGGRGIKMCDEWVKDFGEFLRYMGEKPKGLTLERCDVNRGYEPGNCIWATRTSQAQNTRANVATWEIVREIRSLWANGTEVNELAEKFCMSRGNIEFIVQEKTWREDSP